MDSNKNKRFQVGPNSSPYALGKNYNNYLEEVANTIPYVEVKNKDAKVKQHYIAETVSLYEKYVPNLESRDYLLEKICFYR